MVEQNNKRAKSREVIGFKKSGVGADEFRQFLPLLSLLFSKFLPFQFLYFFVNRLYLFAKKTSFFWLTN